MSSGYTIESLCMYCKRFVPNTGQDPVADPLNRYDCADVAEDEKRYPTYRAGGQLVTYAGQYGHCHCPCGSYTSYVYQATSHCTCNCFELDPAKYLLHLARAASREVA